MLACTCGAGFSAPCGSNWMGAKSRHCTVAGAEAPYDFVDLFIGQWLSLPGMQPRQLIMVLPAYGTWFRCDSKDPGLLPGKCSIVSSNRISHNRAHNLRCGSTGRGAGSPPCLHSAHHSPNITTPRMLDKHTKTAVFNAFRRDGPPSSPHWKDGFIEQIWYDDWETIGMKAKMARDKCVLVLHQCTQWRVSILTPQCNDQFHRYDLGGVGLYQSTGGYPDGEDCGGCMWPVYQSIKANFVQNQTASMAND